MTRQPPFWHAWRSIFDYRPYILVNAHAEARVRNNGTGLGPVKGVEWPVCSEMTEVSCHDQCDSNGADLAVA